MATSNTGLEEEVSKHISSLEGALAVITATKRQLANNAAQVSSCASPSAVRNMF